MVAAVVYTGAHSCATVSRTPRVMPQLHRACGKRGSELQCIELSNPNPNLTLTLTPNPILPTEWQADPLQGQSAAGHAVSQV